MGRTKTPRGIARIERKLKEVEPGTVRHELLEAARGFKRSWVHMGEKLSAVAESRAYEDWGYSSFEDYCIGEIGIRLTTAQKLLNSIRFLVSNAPDALKADGIERPVPDFEVVSRLAGAQKRGALYGSELNTVVEEVFSEPDASPADAMRAMRETRCFQDYSAEIAKKRAERLAASGPDWDAILDVANRLLNLLSAATDAPKELVSDAKALVAAIETLAES